MALDTRIRELGKTLLDAAQEIKGKDIVGLDLSEVESYTDFILIASGGSDRQTKALADNIIRRMYDTHRLHPLGIEGYSQGEWILIDFGDVIAHIFFEGLRKNYHLEDMWLHVIPVPEDDLVKMLSGRPAKAKAKAAKAPARPAARRVKAAAEPKPAARKRRKS